MEEKKEDLDYWVKASIENKINQKNTWNSNLIEYFKDLNTFQEHKGINFQKASTVLGGCIKVYATRVDDVTDYTSKLMKMFVNEDEKVKKIRKNNFDFLAPNDNTINIRLDTVDSYYDSLTQSILNRNDQFFLSEVLRVSREGIFLCLQPNSIEIEFDSEIKIEFDYKKLPLCKGLKEFVDIRREELSFVKLTENNHEVKIIQNVQKQKNVDLSNLNPIENNTNINSNQEEIDNYEVDLDLNDHDIIQNDNIEKDFTVFKPEDTIMNASVFQNFDMIEGHISEFDNPLEENDVETQDIFNEPNLSLSLNNKTEFEYFPNKFGPNFWKVNRKNKKSEGKKKIKREKYFLDFYKPVEVDNLLKTKEHKMNKEELTMFKCNKNLLPEDYSFEVKDLYKLILNPNETFNSVNYNSNELNNFKMNEHNLNDKSLVEDLNSLNINFNNDIDFNNNNNSNKDNSLNNSLNKDNSIINNSNKDNSIINNSNIIDKNNESLEIILDPLKFSKTAKKVNIIELKSNISKEISLNNNSLTKISKNIPKKYKNTKEANEINIHFCLISLLHLANENNFELENKDNDIVIHR